MDQNDIYTSEHITFNIYTLRIQRKASKPDRDKRDMDQKKYSSSTCLPKCMITKKTT